MSRFDKIAEKLDELKLDAMLITSEPGRLYAAAFHSTAGAALVTREKSWFFTDSRYIEAARKAITGAEIRENTRDWPISRLVTEALAGVENPRIGYEENYTTVAEFSALNKKLPGKLAAASRLLEELRTVKDEGEVEKLIAAQRIAEAALEETLNFIRPGRREQEIAAYLQYQMLLRGAEKMSFDPIVVSGANSSMPHGVPTAKAVENGDFITMDFGCICGGYCSDMTRTVAVGHVTEEMETVYRTVLRAQLAGIAAAKAGVTGKAVDAAARQVIEDAGYGDCFGHSFGHGLGVEIHEAPNASPGWGKPLPAGTVISAEPGIYLPGKFGVRIEDVIVVEENGCRNITLAPKDLLIL